MKTVRITWQKLDNIKIFGEIEVSAIEQLKKCAENEHVINAAIMADGHLGYSMPIGGVIEYDGAISPTGVGFDIACGNMAVKTDLNISQMGYPQKMPGEANPRVSIIKPIMRQIQKNVEFGMGRNNPTPIESDVFEDCPAWEFLEQHHKGLKKKAQNQLGTVGSGNHYVDLLVDTQGYIWIANHFGSRGLGHNIASGFMALHGGSKFTDRIPEGEEAVVFETDSELGQQYIECMNLAGRYAYAGREYVIQQVLDILQTEPVFSVHNHHNFAWQSKYNGNWFIGKGATPLTYEPSFIGGSMGDISVIVRGKTLSDRFPSKYEHVIATEDIGALGFAPHGAGRVMSRTKAAGKMRKMWVCSNRDCDWSHRAAMNTNARAIFTGEDTFEYFDSCPKCGGTKFKKLRMRDKSSAAIDWDSVRADLTNRGIVVLGAGADESPGVYKDLRTVLGYHSNIEIMEVLQPIGVVMAGPDTFDPYAD